MSNLSLLLKRVNAMHKELQPGRRHWHIGIAAGTEVSPDIRTQWNVNDTVVIREYPAGLLGDDSQGYAWYEEQYLT
jgi:hypothetical protein